MTDGPRLDIIGAALADSSRARILCELMEGRAFTNKELACAAAITPQTASAHLKHLQAAGLTSALRSGRHVYHRLAGEQVADMLERLAWFSPRDHLCRHHRTTGRDGDMRFARRCYNHLAGRLGVLLAQRLCEMGVLLPDGDALRPGTGYRRFCGVLGLGPDAALGRSAPARLCLDWTERRHHLSGPFATAFLDVALEGGWFGHRTGSRALILTDAGYSAFAQHLGLSRDSIESVGGIDRFGI